MIAASNSLAPPLISMGLSVITQFQQLYERAAEICRTHENRSMTTDPDGWLGIDQIGARGGEMSDRVVDRGDRICDMM